MATQQLVDALAGAGRDEHRARWPRAPGASAVVAGAAVGLVDHQQLGHVARPDLGQHGADGVDLALGVRRRPVDHVDEEVGLDAPTSSVERNASTSWWGSLRTKPTVSVSSTVSPPGRASCRVRGSSVTNSRFSTSTPASVSRLSSVDFPALV